MSLRTKALLAIILASFFWSTAGIPAKALVRIFDPWTLTTYRFAIASFLLLPFFLRTKHARSLWKDVIPLGIFSAINVFLFYYAIGITTSNASALIYTTVPIMTALIAKLAIHESLSRRKLFGIIIGLVGAITIIMLPIIEHSTIVNGNSFGNVLLFIAVISWSFYGVGSRKLMKANTYSPLEMSFVTFVTMTAIGTSYLLITHKPLFSTDYIALPTLSWLLYSVIFLTVLTIFLYQWASQHVSATTVALKQYVETPMAIIWNWIFLGERLTVGFGLGSLLIFIGVYIASGLKLFQKRKT